MKARWLCSLAAASALTVPAFSQIQIYIGPPPPPVRYEVRPVMPAEDFVWVDGYWGTRGNRYVWVPGAYWTHPHYDHYQQGWQVHEGHWDREDHRDHHDDHHDHEHGDHHDHDR